MVINKCRRYFSEMVRARFLFDSKGAKGFASDENRMYAIQALINSTVAKRYLEFFHQQWILRLGILCYCHYVKRFFFR